MCDFPVNLLVRQTLRGFILDSGNMIYMHTRVKMSQQVDKGHSQFEGTFTKLILDPHYLIQLYDKPDDHITTLYKDEFIKRSLSKSKNEDDARKERYRVLLSFLKELKDNRTLYAMEWVAFHHYLYYIYRYFFTAKPGITNETLPEVLVLKMQAHLNYLTKADRTQFYIRIITLIREYVCVAAENYEKIITTEPNYLISLLTYYGALCSSANKLTEVMANFSEYLYKKYKLNWHSINLFMFHKYFYLRKLVQDRLPMFERIVKDKRFALKACIEEYGKFKNDMRSVEEKFNPSAYTYKGPIDKDINKIMKTNYWIFRVDVGLEFEGNFMEVLTNDTDIAERLIASRGNCLCEDCLTAEVRILLTSRPMVVTKQADGNPTRHVTCYLCEEYIALDALVGHIVFKHDPKTFKWDLNLSMKKCPKRSSKMLHKLLNSHKDEAGSSDGQKFDELMLDSFTSDVMVHCEYEDKEVILPQKRSGKKSKRGVDDKQLDDFWLFVDADEDQRKEKEEEDEESVRFQDADEDGEEMPCIGHGCGHKCKKDDEKKKEECCDHAKDSKKCDCAYCEGVASHGHKSTETRDRLRTRLNQRKERITEILKEVPIPEGADAQDIAEMQKHIMIGFEISKKAMLKKKMKSSTVAPKIPEVPPKNLEGLSSLSTSSLNSIQENCDVRDIDDLIHYIEGHKPVDKVALAQKKAAKKARQRAKKEEEKQRKEAEEEAKRREEERIRQEKIREEERQKALELAKKQAEELKKNKKANAKKPAENNKSKNKNKKKGGGSSSTSTTQSTSSTSNNTVEAKIETVEESIPAVVTIKRVVEDENSPPLVTITLKGQTPDQDKLLYTLVNGASKEAPSKTQNTTNKNDKSSGSSSNNNNNNNSTSKDKQKADNTNSNTTKKSKKKSKSNSTNTTNIVTVNGNKDKTTPTTSTSESSSELRVTLAIDKSFRKNVSESPKPTELKQQNNKKKDKKKADDKTAAAQQQNSSSSTANNQQGNKAVPPLAPSSSSSSKQEEFDIPSLRLPPGITITKVNGPITHKNCKASSGNNGGNGGGNSTTGVGGAAPPGGANNGQSFPPVNKSGVIVVDTEKLIQQSLTVSANKKSKKNKKKKNPQVEVQVQQQAASQQQTASTSKLQEPAEPKPAMVTLKNPIFHSMQSKLNEKNDLPVMSCNEQASITKGENGMVTIRRPRCLQLPLQNESPMNDYLNDLKPVISPERPPYYPAPGTLPNGKVKARTPFNPESSRTYSEYGLQENTNTMPSSSSSSSMQGTSFTDWKNEGLASGISSNPPVLSAHDILWGLPGIEITKVNKNSNNQNTYAKKCQQTADVSIIPTSTNGEKFNFDKDDWPYESVFAPKDILEDDLDADERELEAFKRFCSQSVPPKHKEKITHLNVKDIIFKKKADVTY